MPHPLLNWPYAALAIVQHEWDTNHLNVWLIFRHPMDQTVKPPNNLWLCEADSVPKAITVSAWQDPWTILLTVPDVLALPGTVTLAYDGPSVNLRTTWAKQWHPWGPILSLNIPYGWEDIIVVDTVNRRVGINGPPLARTFEVISADGSNRLTLHHDNSHAYLMWDKGFLELQSDEGPNANTTVELRGKGTGIGRLYVYDQDNAEWFYWYCVNQRGSLTVSGNSPLSMDLQIDGDIPIRMFRGLTEGQTPELQINGHRAGDVKRYLGISIGKDAANSISFFGLLNYLFDGDLKASGAVSSGTRTYSTGPAAQDAVDVTGINTLFIDASATAITIGGLVGGLDGQLLNIVIIDHTNDVTLEHAEGTANQDILLHAGADETVDGHFGGWTLVCHAGVDWHDASHAKHV